MVKIQDFSPEIDKLKDYILENYPTELSEDESPVQRAIAIMTRQQHQLHSLHAGELVFRD